MNIRTMNNNDYEQVYSLWLSTPGMGLNNVDDSKEGISKYLRVVWFSTSTKMTTGNEFMYNCECIYDCNF